MIPLSIVWDVDPIAFSIGSVNIAWYGILWVLGLYSTLLTFTYMVKHEGLNPDMETSGFMYCVLGTIIGARLGHCIFYDPAEFLLDPFMSDFPWIKILNMRGGGLASHGAAMGLLVGIWLFTRKWKVPYIWLLDRVGVMVPLCGALVRMGNYVNSEVYGTQTDLPWGVIFVNSGEILPMHPTQLYEALAYLVMSVMLLLIYWCTRIAMQKRGVIFGLFLILLFGFRFVIEMIKQPQEIWEQGMTLNMGQILSIPFVIAGVVILVWAIRRPAEPYADMPTKDTKTLKNKQSENKPSKNKKK